MENSREIPPIAVSGNGAHVVHIPEILLREAYEKMSKGQHVAASQTFEDVLRRFESLMPEDERNMIHLELGQLYFWLSEYEAAKHHAEHVLTFSGNNDEANVILGKVALMKFQFPQARGYFSKISADNPARSLGLCLVALKLRNTLSAESFLNEARSKIPSPTTHLEFRVCHAYVMLLKGDTKFAIGEARDILKKCGQNPPLLLLLGEIFVTAGNYGEATATAEKVLKSCPANDHAFSILAHGSYARESFSEADAHARKAVEFNPENAYAKTVLMKIALRNGNDAYAEEIGVQILRDAPEYSLGHANLGDVYFAQGRYELAQIEYEQTQQLMNADTKGARLRKARMAFISENYSEAKNILEKLIDGYHTYYDDAMCDLFLCYDRMGEEEKRDELRDKMAYRRSFYHRTEQLLKSFEE